VAVTVGLVKTRPTLPLGGGKAGRSLKPVSPPRDRRKYVPNKTKSHVQPGGAGNPCGRGPGPVRGCESRRHLRREDTPSAMAPPPLPDPTREPSARKGQIYCHRDRTLAKILPGEGLVTRLPDIAQQGRVSSPRAVPPAARRLALITDAIGVPLAPDDRLRWIFRKLRLRLRQFAKQKSGAFAGDDLPHVKAGLAEAH
jgi:hypothetical protein